MVDDQQITVANGVGAILRLALAVTVARVAGNARVAHPGRTQSLARLLFEGVKVFEEVLARIEIIIHASLFGSRCNGRIAGLLGSTQLTTRKPLVGSEVARSLAEHLLVEGQRAQILAIGTVATIGTCCQQRS